MGDIPPDDGKGIRATELLTVIRCDCGRKAASGIAKEQIWVASTVDLLRRQRKQYQCETPRSNFQMLTEGLPAGSIPIKSRTPIVEWTVVCQLATKADKEVNRPSRSAPASIKICKRQFRWNGDV